MGYISQTIKFESVHRNCASVFPALNSTTSSYKSMWPIENDYDSEQSSQTIETPGDSTPNLHIRSKRHESASDRNRGSRNRHCHSPLNNDVDEYLGKVSRSCRQPFEHTRSSRAVTNHRCRKSNYIRHSTFERETKCRKEPTDIHALACPFVKHDRGRHGRVRKSCTQTTGLQWSNMIQHMNESHSARFKCLYCQKPWTDGIHWKSECRTHFTSGSCQGTAEQHLRMPECMDERQELQYQDDCRDTLSADERWTLLYMRLFPGEWPIPLPGLHTP